MKLLLSNDDGVNARGLEVLYNELKGLAKTLKVVAPDRDHSGASNSLTLDRPLKPHQHSNGFVSVDGTPTDCVHLGVTNMFDIEFDRVISGINNNGNLGDDVIYSGTVAAAMEGRFLKYPPIAVSLASKGFYHFETAARVVATLLRNPLALEVPARTILNVNVPDVPYDELKGLQVTRLGHRARGGMPEKVINPRGQERYWIGSAGEGDDAGAGTDFYAIAHGYVSVSPIQVDMTRHESLPLLSAWLEGCQL
ncbi:MAG: 5'/3'-nucleotidase SurE [Hahellaceae bacterium]|jgi:5'-nucleotidase|nr:5'/3'-nucleotidase SurE [Hahellaceae bacterium]MCP5213186.1 5'/3'-nucleotidase SurE [Hahellaceae bacterium]